MTLCRIESIEKKYVEDAAKLFAERYRVEREYMPLLPSRYENHNTIVPLLSGQIKKTPGVVAIENGKLTGYLIGQSLHFWRGRRSVFVPFWAHSVEGENRKEIYQQMYAYLSSEWVANGCFTHMISVLAHDEEIIDTLFWLGFGMVAVDTMRDFRNIQGPVADVEIQLATLDDLDVVVSLDHELARYLTGPPIFMAMTEKRSREYHEKWLSKPSHSLWLASYEGQVVSYMKICPLNDDSIITDEKTAWIEGAYTKEHMRGKGIGTALLNQALKWAQSQGYKRCAVDFEGENVLGSAFWLRYFEPICFSLIRQIDKRIAWAHKDRDDRHFW